MLIHKMRTLGSGRTILSRLSPEHVTSVFQRQLGLSCLSTHQGQRHFAPAAHRSFDTAPQLTHILGQPPCHCRKVSSVSLLDSLPVQKSGFLQQTMQSDILRTGGTGNLLFKSCVAEYHTTSQRQVINDEDVMARKEGWFRKHRMRLKSAPPAALVLGFSGLIPFVTPAVYSIVTFSCGPQAALAQVAYGACILSFLGGVRWGFAIAPSQTTTSSSLVFSVLPSLVAWAGLSMPIQPGLGCIITGLALAGIVDSRFQSFPPWFRSLRFLLTTFAILSVSVTFGFSVLYPPPEPEHGYNFKKLIRIARIIVED